MDLLHLDGRGACGVKKTVKKTVPGKPFTGKDDPRNGKGPAPGSPNAGRPTLELAAMCREIGLQHVIPRIVAYLASTANHNPDSQGFRWAADTLLDRGWGRALQQVTLGNDAESPLIPSDAVTRIMGGLTRLAATRGMGQASSAA